MLLLLGRVYGERYYTAWGDETLFADVAQSYSQGPPFDAPSYSGNGLSMDEKTYFMPPVYLLSLSAWFKLRTPSLSSARMFSNLACILCLIVVFRLGRSIAGKGAGAGVVVIMLVVDVQFASMYNWARPDMLALALSLFSVAVYYSARVRCGRMPLPVLTLSWTIAMLSILVHPICAIMCLAIPLHMCLTNPKELFSLRVVTIFAAVTVLFFGAWMLYAAQDWAVFKLQFIDWQAGRKALRHSGSLSYVRMIIATCLNHGVKGTGLFAGMSTLLMLIVLLRSVKDRASGRPYLLVLLLMILSGFAVHYGRELAYPPLRLPSFYLAILVCISVPVGDGNKGRGCLLMRTEGSHLLLNCRSLFSSVAILLLFKSSISTCMLVRELHLSDRAASYRPSTLAEEIISACEKNSKIGVRLFPDCFFNLRDSGHFEDVRKIGWRNLSPDELESYIAEQGYLAVTYSYLEPKSPGYLLDFAESSLVEFIRNRVAQRHYLLEATIRLPGGGTTYLYRKSSQRQ